MRLHDTRLRAVVDIEPATPGLLRVYACGPTVYKPQHVGNLRAALLPDLICRLAGWHRLSVRYVQNITDVGHLDEDSGEDKLIAEARARGLSPLQIAREIEALYAADALAIGVRPPDEAPRATEFVPKMVAMAQRLIDAGAAYVSGGSVFFDARSFPSYGEVSGNRIADLVPQASGRISDAEEAAKRFSADWALWRGTSDAAAQDELVFDSPWGPGTPGWHLECSAMSAELLDGVVDVHTGGIDLRFPHHEDERAQSNAAAGLREGEEVVRHWVHAEHLLFEGRKMSKTTGNVVLLSDVTARGLDPLAVRLVFLTTRYRTQANLSWSALAASDTRLRRWRELVRQWADAPGAPEDGGVVEAVVAAYDDDLDTPRAITLLAALAKDEGVEPGARYATVALLDRLLGLDLTREVGRPPPRLPAGADEMLAQREAARVERDWARADGLRAELAGLGVAVADTPEGPVATLA